MSEAIKNALAREEGKLVRQIANAEATVAVMEVLGDNAKERNKHERQLQAIKDTKANIAKLKKACDALK